MKANEIRVCQTYKQFGVIKTLFFSDFSDFGLLCNSLNPIPLTEEWLLKFGFNRLVKDLGWDVLRNDKIELVEVPTNKGKKICFKYGTDRYSYIKYVHQLQNLYFTLTGEELELNEIIEK